MEIQILSKSDELLQCFFTGRNRQTLEAYRADLEDLKVHLGETELTKAVSKFIALQPGEANSTVLRYRNNLIERGLQSSTINRRLAAIRVAPKISCPTVYKPKEKIKYVGHGNHKSGSELSRA